MKATPFRDPTGQSSSVAVLIETPDILTLEKALAEPDAAEAERHDGVRVDTIRILLAQ